MKIVSRMPSTRETFIDLIVFSHEVSCWPDFPRRPRVWHILNTFPEAFTFTKSGPMSRKSTSQHPPSLISDPTEAIRARAHAIWIEEGRPEGRDREHWARAEQEVSKLRTNGATHSKATATRASAPAKSSGSDSKVKKSRSK